MLLSIIITAYNKDEFRIRPLPNPPYDVEYIVINDNPDWDATELGLDWADIIINHNENKGTFYSRNDGFKHSKGDYIWFWDSDDTQLDWPNIDPYVDITQFISENAYGSTNESDIKDKYFKSTTDEMLRTMNALKYKDYLSSQLWSMIIKREVLENAYKKADKYINDYIVGGEDFLLCSLFDKNIWIRQTTNKCYSQIGREGPSHKDEVSKAMLTTYKALDLLESDNAKAYLVNTVFQNIQAEDCYFKDWEKWAYNGKEERTIAIGIVVGPGHTSYLKNLINQIDEKCGYKHKIYLYNNDGSFLKPNRFPNCVVIGDGKNVFQQTAKKRLLNVIKEDFTWFIDADDSIPFVYPFKLYDYAVNKFSAYLKHENGEIDRYAWWYRMLCWNEILEKGNNVNVTDYKRLQDVMWSMIIKTDIWREYYNKLPDVNVNTMEDCLVGTMIAEDNRMTVGMIPGLNYVYVEHLNKRVLSLDTITKLCEGYDFIVDNFPNCASRYLNKFIYEYSLKLYNKYKIKEDRLLDKIMTSKHKEMYKLWKINNESIRLEYL